jgi:hypothetical protein
MKKTTHTMGTKSYAGWYEDMVSHLLKLYMILLTFPLLLFFRGKLILKKQPHRAMVYLVFHRKKEKWINEPVICYIRMGIFLQI